MMIEGYIDLYLQAFVSIFKAIDVIVLLQTFQQLLNAIYIMIIIIINI